MLVKIFIFSVMIVFMEYLHFIVGYSETNSFLLVISTYILLYFIKMQVQSLEKNK